ncbi:2-isopropylmalate synthase [Pseudoalteromonas piscicida]|uniref:2-isopropylmalate synthase n=1 Tax=Pseudoalteromonas piscicida TaxID=43662 RepID=A0A2A5JN09_PSEO7|nr:2-isopropylmalate synthase [Pseudoalteromonas piscicida]PCK30719.1 2-isopropylmalate synthase [Pseudoalteromonas piscicida]
MTTFHYKKYRCFPPVNLKNRTWPDQLIKKAPIWNSVDLRDGNQALVEPMTVEQKLRMFKLLVKLGFKEIEIGFPAASSADFDFCRYIIDNDLVPDDVVIQAITQAREDLITKTYEALSGVKKGIVLIYNVTSKVQREQVYGHSMEQVISMASDAAQLVQDMSADYPETEWTFHYGLESFTGTELDFAVKVCDAVTDVWKPTPDKKIIMSLPATVEMSTPNIYADQVEYFLRHVKNRESMIVSVHTHNDRGCGVASAELALMAGADRVEGTLLGNGERTGNMDIVTMAMNLYSQGIDPELDLSHMDEIIACVEHCTNIATHPRHPYIGELVYSAFSGGHQHAIRKCLSRYQEGDVWDVAYLPINPKDIGRSYQQLIRINSQSGKGGIAFVLESSFGVKLPRWMQLEFRQVVQDLAEEDGGELAPQDIWGAFEQSYFLPSSDDSRVKKVEERAVAYLVQRLSELERHRDNITDSLKAHGPELLRECFGLDVDLVKLDVGSKEQSFISFVQINVDATRYIGCAIDNSQEEALIKGIVSGVFKIPGVLEQKLEAYGEQPIKVA